MLRPSYSELMDIIAQSGRLDKRVASRYTVVQAAAKRARQLTEGSHPLTYAPTDRAVSIAIKEMAEGMLRINVNEGLLENNFDHLLTDQNRIRLMAMLPKDELHDEQADDYDSYIDGDNDKPDTYAPDDDFDTDTEHTDVAMMGFEADDEDDFEPED